MAQEVTNRRSMNKQVYCNVHCRNWKQDRRGGHFKFNVVQGFETFYHKMLERNWEKSAFHINLQPRCLFKGLLLSNKWTNKQTNKWAIPKTNLALKITESFLFCWLPKTNKGSFGDWQTLFSGVTVLERINADNPERK